jgi:hypothetical protein
MLDVKFLQYYNETAIENFISVVKQNLLFQAQIRGFEEQLKIIPELQNSIGQFEELKKELVRLKDDNVNLTNQLNSKLSIVETANKVDTERFRLQTAVNSQAKEITNYKNIIADLQNKVDEEKEYTKQLQEMLPKTAKKKLGIAIVDVLPKEDALPILNDEKTDQIVSSGGTF